MTDKSGSQADDLIRDGIEDIKAGDKEVGRGKLEAAVKIDQYNELAWFWLASVVDTVEERRVCLGNVLLINPQNERAHQMLERLEGRPATPSFAGDDFSAGEAFEGAAAPARSRPPLLYAIGIVGGGLIVAAVLFLVISGGGGVVVPTPFATATMTFTPDVAGTETAQASITPTITISPTPTLAQLGAVWTDTPAPTITPTPEPLPAPPADLPGRIILQSGDVVGGSSYHPIYVVAAGNPASVQLVSGPDERGQHPAMAAGATQFVWAQYFSSTRSVSMKIQPFGASAASDISAIFNNDPILFDANYPDWQGNFIILSAQSGESDHELWLLSPSGQAIPPGTAPLLRLTNDAADNLWGNFDPTGTAAVYVAAEGGLTDLRVVNIALQESFPLTQNGNALTESAPDWGPNNEIVFSASVQGSNASDIYIMPADGSQEPTLLFDYGLHDIQPRFSPDGRYIVFSTDRSETWDVVIFDRETSAYYGLAIDPESIEIANGWTE